MTWMWSTVRPATLAFLAILGTGACADRPDPVEPLPFEEIDEVTYHESLEVSLEEMEVTDSGVYWVDLEPGDGAAADPGMRVTFTYLVRYRNGQTLDSSDFSGPYTFTVDDLSTGTMQGFNDGIRGMLEGGRRKFIVPPELGNGQGGPWGILIFDVVLLSSRTP